MKLNGKENGTHNAATAARKLASRLAKPTLARVLMPLDTELADALAKRAKDTDKEPGELVAQCCREALGVGLKGRRVVRLELSEFVYAMLRVHAFHIGDETPEDAALDAVRSCVLTILQMEESTIDEAFDACSAIREAV